ncbi:MAG: amidohydrolase family protein [Acidobacteriota bacterium]|nr:amidohydrolase family protein [Acidobacteriota bacterium]
MTGRTIIRGGPILAADGHRWRHRAFVILIGDRIVEVAEGDPPRPESDDRLIDLEGRYLLPGMVDSHFHLISRSASTVDDTLVAAGMLEGAASAVTRLAGGVTSVRDCGCRHGGIHVLRQAIAAGTVPGPAAAVAGRNPTTSLAPKHWRNVVADGPAAMAAAVGAEVAAGADFVKLILAHAEDPADWSAVTRYINDDELAAAVTAARVAGVRTGVHCEGWEEARRAVAAGVDVLDHAPLVDTATAEEMAAKGTVYVPTLWAFSDDSGIGPRTFDGAAVAVRRWQAEHLASVRRAVRAGVTIAAGSDAAGALPPHDVLVDEMHRLTAAGLSVGDAVRAATLGGAAALGRPGEVGEISVGARADLIVVGGDPLSDLDVLRTPSVTFAGGRAYDAGQLRQDWAAGSGDQAVTARWAHASR